MDIKYKIKVVCVSLMVLAVIILLMNILSFYIESDNVKDIKGIFI